MDEHGEKSGIAKHRCWQLHLLQWTSATPSLTKFWSKTHMVEIRIFVELWTWPEWISHHPFAVPPPSIESCWGSLSLSLSVCASSPMIKPCLYIHIYPELFVHHSSFIIPPCVSGCLSFIMHPLSSDLVVKSLATRLHQLAYPYSSIFHWSSTVQLPFFGEHPWWLKWLKHAQQRVVSNPCLGSRTVLAVLAASDGSYGWIQATNWWWGGVHLSSALECWVRVAWGWLGIEGTSRKYRENMRLS